MQRNPSFEVRPSVITGDTADVYLHRTQRILRNEGLNPTVVMEFSATQNGVLCGALEVRAVLAKVTSEGNREIWAVEEGSSVEEGDVCLYVRAPYSSFGLYETAICGMLAHHSGWATAASELVAEAGSIPVVSMGAHSVHPSVAPAMDYAAVVGRVRRWLHRARRAARQHPARRDRVRRPGAAIGRSREGNPRLRPRSRARRATGRLRRPAPGRCRPSGSSSPAVSRIIWAASGWPACPAASRSRPTPCSKCGGGWTRPGRATSPSS